jgi:hypothetical protein
VDGRGAIERVGGWETVRGVLLTAALVAVPTAPSMAAVLGRWVPAAEHPLAMAVLAGLAWLLLASWFLHGALSLLRQQAAVGAPGPAPSRAPAFPPAGSVLRSRRATAARRPGPGLRTGAGGPGRTA